MVIDEFMPLYDVSKRYSMTISASVDTVYSALKIANINDSPIIRVLFFLRGLPAIFKSKTHTLQKGRLTISDIAGSGFMMLDEKPNDEMVIGIVGKFWKLSGNIHRIPPEQFRAFNENNFAKAAWNFRLRPVNQAVTELSTETRIKCTDEASRKKFSRYWIVIGPFSGIIRKEMLKIVKRDAEK